MLQIIFRICNADSRTSVLGAIDVFEHRAFEHHQHFLKTQQNTGDMFTPESISATLTFIIPLLETLNLGTSITVGFKENN